MFTLSNGKVLERKVMQDELRASAVAAGLDPKRIGTHSLRVTCACWLYHSGHDIGYIKRHGRWISDVVHVYLWEGDGKRGVAEQMAKADFQLHVHL
jgi:integrase